MPKDPAVFMGEMMNQEWEADGLHCWTLTRMMVKDCFGINLPAVLKVAPSARREKAEIFNSHSERHNWREIESPFGYEWAVCLMYRKGAMRDFFEHSGVYVNIEGGIVFHVDHPHGCVCDTVMEVVQLRKWAQPRFFVPL